MCIGLHVNCPLLLFDFNETWIFLTDFRKILEYQIWWKSFLWYLRCCMRTDGHRDFVNAPKNESTWHKTKLIMLQFCERLHFSVRLTAGLRLVLVWFLCVPIPLALQSNSYSIARIAASNLTESTFCWVYSVLFRPECVCLIVRDLEI